MTLRRDVSDLELISRPPTRHDRPVDTVLQRVTRDAPFIAAFRRSQSLDAGAPGQGPAPFAASSGTQPDVILVKSGFKQVAARVGEILFVKAARNYVRIHLESGQVLKSRVPIDRLGVHLGRERFLRIHRGCIVNVDRIRGVTPLPGGRLSLGLTNGSTVVVARDRRRAVLAEIGAGTPPR